MSNTEEHAAASGTHHTPQSSFWRPQEGCNRWVDLLTSVDHKKIGIGYAVAALFFLLLGGAEALIIRLQLMSPENALIDARTYNQLFTMHGTTMVFLAIMPLSAAFFNYLLPLQIGARDVAFPRMNALSLWTFVFGGILLNMTWFFSDGAPAIGWFAYAPLSGPKYSPGMGANFWILSLQILGIASMVGSFNFITTVINMRAPGMKMMRMPIFAWMTFVTAFLIILSFPAITVALFQLMFDRQFGTHFFNAEMGGKPILWQHLFWVFGHPEVYILILPAMGIVSEILPTFSRRPLFGYPMMVFSGAIIGFLGFTVWSHHMFTTGMGIVATSAFSIMTMLISIPTGVKIFNWIGTMWGGKLRFPLPMLFALGFLWLFMMGGFTGVMHSSVPGDAQQQDSYFVIAHFHYVLIGGALFSLLGGIAFWFPKVTGRMLNESYGKLLFWIMFAGFNLFAFPLHFLGLSGMPRRTHTYKSEMGWDIWNHWSTIGALVLGVSILLFVIHVVWASKKGAIAKDDPWDARTLEWGLPSPTPIYNFAKTPIVNARDQFWANKYGSKSEKAGEAIEAEGGIHMPDRSWMPFFTAFGIFLIGLGMVFLNSEITLFGLDFSHHFEIAAIGGLVTFAAILGWALEGPGGYHIHPQVATENNSNKEDA